MGRDCKNTTGVFMHKQQLTPSFAGMYYCLDLQAATILGQLAEGGSCCSLCRGVDHSPSHCALGPLQQPLMPPQPANPIVPSSINTRQAGQSRPRLMCTSWNGDRCTYPGNCTFRHVCFTCGQWHQARDYKDTPHDSPFKRGLPNWRTSSGRGY